MEELSALYRKQRPLLYASVVLAMMCASCFCCYSNLHMFVSLNYPLQRHQDHSFAPPVSRDLSVEDTPLLRRADMDTTKNDHLIENGARQLQEQQEQQPSAALPDFPDLETAPAAGGIIFFVHVPKTGGTTIRDNFSNRTKFQNVNYKPVFTKKQFEGLTHTMDKKLDRPHRNDGDILFVEIHGRNTPTLTEVAPQLQAWKQKAHAQGIPFYTFTLLRDNVDLAVSFFNYFHVRGDDRFEQMEGTIDNMRQTLQRNPQCLYLFKGEQAFCRPKRFFNVTQIHCDKILATLEDVMDWVGDTKDMSKVTLPLLAYWVTGSAKYYADDARLESSNVAKTHSSEGSKYLARSELDPDTIELIRSKAQLDQSLFERSIRIQNLGGRVHSVVTQG